MMQAMVKSSLVGPRAGTKHGQKGRLGCSEKWKPARAFTERSRIQRGEKKRGEAAREPVSLKPLALLK